MNPYLWAQFSIAIHTKKTVADVPQSDTMKVSEDKGNVEVHTVEKIIGKYTSA